jgi:signal transduction histidine kinase
LVELIAAPLGRDGTFQGIVESVRDITERVRAEEELQAVHAVRRQLIEGERERIARELHDGLAQLLGYVKTKAMAVRLMLDNGQTESAAQHLQQLEGAAHELYVDVREAIVDLRTMGREGTTLAAALKDTVAQFSRLSGLSTELALTPEVKDLPLKSESELQLLRIVQESLTNVRKHASASKAWVEVQIDDGILELTVRDDGRGFDPIDEHTTAQPRFGLSMMRQRAEAIGAAFSLHSEPGAGTLIRVRGAVSDLARVVPENRSVTGVER